MSLEKCDRRKFLKISSGALGALIPVAAGAASLKSEAQLIQERGQHQWGMVIDLDRCTGCQACVVACSVENNQMLGSPEEAALGRVIRWMKILPQTEQKEADVSQRLMPLPCQQCEDPPCTRVCPTSATFMNPDGIVGQVYERCIGCRYCVNACPYTCKFFNWGEPQWPEGVEMPFNPDVSIRTKGVVEKCLFCHHRLQRAKDKVRDENRTLQEGDYVPACKSACPAKAIVFGDLKDPESEVSRQASSHRAYTLLDELGTKPKVTYLREG